ncbi:MAG: sodium-dependent transporter [Bdellovibrionaceae bacterium]|nr:sodium-dependent transporter [Pseudobdellovibrionaceae bacterium]|tara:strand:+ start:67181 stop:68536 length:1356 start_codon:yes stop_codon:yes gene_type:complete
MPNNRAHWGSRLAFILAAAGSAIGLGNIWKFPYITGVNGGGAFVILYLFCIFAVGVPILISEMYIGQKAQCNNVQAFRKLASGNKWGPLAGWLGLGSAFMILSFYSVVGGWILDFEFRAITHLLTGDFTDFEDGAALNSLLGNPWRQLAWHAVFMSLVTWIVYRGVKEGLEKWNKILMPTLMGLLVLLFIRVMFLEGFSEAFSFLFSPDFSKLTGDGALEAVGHSFFTLSLGMGAIMVYGSYLDENENLVKTSLAVAFLDTLIALLAGLVIFSIVFTYDLDASAGPGLIFATLPTLFNKMTGGSLLSIAFFFMITFAAITSAVSILEVVIAYWSEHKKVSREKASLIIGFIMFAVGVLHVFSTNLWSDIFNILGKTNFFDLFDLLTSSYMLPIGGVMIALFYGWVLGPQSVDNTIKDDNPVLKLGLLWACRLIAPLLVVIILYSKVKELFA